MRAEPVCPSSPAIKAVGAAAKAKDEAVSERFHAVAAEGRYDLYGPVHKGLRRAHADFLQRLGSADFRRDVQDLLDGLKRHLALAELHLEDEENHIHSAMEARSPGSTAGLEAQHGHHRAALVALRSTISAIETATPAERPPLGRMLYLGFSRFVSEDLEHMADEETVVWPALCALFTDAELAAIEGRIVSSLDPDSSLAFMKLMIPAMNPAERIALLQGLKQGLPDDAYEAVVREATEPLKPDELRDLALQGLVA